MDEDARDDDVDGRVDDVDDTIDEDHGQSRRTTTHASGPYADRTRRTGRGRGGRANRVVIVGEDEAREKAKRQREQRSKDDPAMDGVRVALMAMEARRRQLYNKYSYVEGHEDDPGMRELEERQRRSEILAVDREVQRYKEEARMTAARGGGAELPLGRRLLQGFFAPLTAAIELEQEAIRLKVHGVDRSKYGPFLLMLNPDKLAVITLHTVISQLMKGEQMFGDPSEAQAGMCKFVRAVETLGTLVQAEVNLARLRQRARQNKKRYLERKNGAVMNEDTDAVAGVDFNEHPRDLAEDVEDVDDFIAKPHVHDRFAKVNMDSLKGLTTARGVARLARSALNDSDWGSTTRSKVGAALVNLLLTTARIRVPGPDGGEEKIEVPAFYHDYVKHKGHGYGVVSWHDAFFSFMDDEAMIRATLSPVRYMPMVTPPRPWTRFNAGGYLRTESIVMRGHYTTHGPSKRQMLALHGEQSGAEHEGRTPNFQPVLDALNVLGRTSWRINDDVLKVMEEVWATGGGRADVPPREAVPDPAWPADPYGLRRSRGQLTATALPSRQDVAGFIHSLNRTKQRNRELHSQRCDFLIKLQVAKEMRDEKRIYFPHNIDFRGRAYTMHVHLNHLGSDVCRGALMFAEERPLGPDGLKWLRVQAANLYGGGVDKLPMDERARWIADRHDVVRAAAEDPLSDEGSFWLDAEDPWQCLATCLEIDAAVKSGNPETYRCRLPVHQDGSCNGLQHYAALGRDEAGGEQVNLMPRDRPGDVYTGIANVLRKIVAEDELSAPDPETRRLASLLAPHIDRKLVKQTVMTSVYGVTHVGARQQIQNRLKERGAIDDENARYQVATYAASRTLDALSNLFVNARDVMAWLAECARLVAARGKAVEWTTPMGLPVVQPYRAKGRKVIRTLVQSFVLQFDNDENKVQKNKQRSAFPPNYIHSVDSAHMMKTAVACHAAGLVFAGVHDSFWTHAGDVPEMSKHIREKFIELHSEPLLEQLYDELKQKYPEIAMELPPPPPPGSMDLQSVRESLYFFS
jgi:DNA-directed RNA polymerase